MTGSPRRVLEVVLVVGSLVAGSALGIAAFASEPVGGPRADPTPGSGGGRLAAPGEIFNCLRTQAGLIAVAPDPPQPDGGEVFQFQLEDESVVHVFLFSTEAAAQAYEAGRVEGGPGQAELLLYRNGVLFAFEGITEDLRAAFIGCVDGADGPFPVTEAAGTTASAEALDACRVDAGFAIVDITDVHPDPVRSLRLTRDEGTLVRHLGKVIVEFGQTPTRDVEAPVEDCAAIEA